MPQPAAFLNDDSASFKANYVEGGSGSGTNQVAREHGDARGSTGCGYGTRDMVGCALNYAFTVSGHSLLTFNADSDNHRYECGS